MPFSVFLAVFAVTMPFTGKIIDRYGPRNATITGGVLTGLGWLLASFASSVPMLAVLYGVIGGIGVGITYSVLVAVSARWFPDRRGLAVGLTVFGVGFSAFFTANIAGWLIGAFGVMNTFRIFGIVIIVLTTLLALPLEFPPSGWIPHGWTPPALKPGEEQPCECNRSQMLRSSSFYGLWACYFIGCLAGLMAISIAQPVGTEVGIATGLATFLVGFFAIFNGAGRPVFGVLTDTVNAPECCHRIVHPDRRCITAHVADPDRTGIHPFLCPALGMSRGLAGHRTDNHRRVFWHRRLPAVLRGCLPRVWCRRHRRAAAGRVHQDLDGILYRGIPVCAGTCGSRYYHRVHPDETTKTGHL